MFLTMPKLKCRSGGGVARGVRKGPVEGLREGLKDSKPATVAGYDFHRMG
jgi:hypothetical protein